MQILLVQAHWYGTLLIFLGGSGSQGVVLMIVPGSFVNSRKNQESNYQGQMLEIILVQFWVSHDHHCASETRK